jgi:hypothetical protein
MNAADLHKPRLGFFKMTLCKGGPMVPVQVAERGERCPKTGEPLEDIEVLVEVDGQLVRLDRVDETVARVNIWATAIDRAEYQFMLADSEWCRERAPDDPKAKPRVAIDLETADPIF